MKTAPSPRNNDDAAAFAPDLSEGTEIGVYLALLELIDEGLIVTGDEYIIDANSAACRLLGRSYRQLAGQPLADLFANGRAFLDAREKLLIRGETRGTLELVLPNGHVHAFPYIAAARLRPGIHAIVLGFERANGDVLSAPPPCDGPLTLHFQPQVHVRDNTLHAVEALPRQQAPEQDSHNFAHLAAAMANASEAAVLDAPTLTAICRAARAWPLLGCAPTVSVNIAAGQVRGDALPSLVGSALRASQLEAGRLELSLDAHAFSLPEDDLSPTLQALADMGVRLAVDHFGHIPVPLAQLPRHRLDVLKLDAALAARVGRDDGDTALIEAIVRMTAPLGIRVLARGVHTEAQRDFLLALGCELQQGPFFGTARDEHAFADFLSNRSS
ncbi:MAG: EAL domain-containing protein [Azoarcus sp.]|nr:EAL domain-containing protein [Azoarcus sp.]